MTPLSLDAPLRSLLDTAHAGGRVSSQADLGNARRPPVRQGVVGQAILVGDRIKLSTLASYARAAGYVLSVGFGLDADGSWAAVGVGDDLDITVAGARALLAALGLEMTLAVETVEEKRP